MRLTRLTLRHFRNLGVQELDFPPEGVAIVGDNAQGKSNLLEAVYYLETFRSFRGSRDERLVAFGEDVFRVVGTMVGEDGAGVEVAAAFQRSGKGKRVTVDGREPGRVGDALGRLAAVIFSPADISLVSGAPSERRRFLDIALSLSVPGYLLALQRYRRILQQRNALLKEGRAGALVQAFDQGLVEAGSAVVRARRAWVERWRGEFARYYAAVSGGPTAGMTYRSSVPLDGEGCEEVEEAYREALAASAERERRATVTVVGPHRDELRLSVAAPGGEIDLREYGSGGQRRTAALALRLVEARTIREVRGHEPLVLLDDVFAELDAGRSARVLELMEEEETGQVMITAPREGDVRFREDRLPRWRIRGGVLST